MDRIITTPEFNGMIVNATKAGGCYKEILDALLTRLSTMRERHGKVLVGRIDLHFPKNWHEDTDNDKVSIFLARFMAAIRETADAQYVAVREQGEKHPHYHIVVMVDGQKHRNGFFMKPIAERIWRNVLNRDATGLVEIVEPYCGNAQGGFFIVRGSESEEWAVNEAFSWCSYIGKTRSKIQNDGQRSLFCSMGGAK